MKNRLNIIFYDENKPRFYQVNKKIISKIILTLPLLLVSVLAISLAYSFYLKVQIKDLLLNEPSTVRNLKKELVLIEKKNIELVQRNTNLEKKISFGASTTHSEYLALMKTPLSMDDLRSQKLIEIESPFIKFEQGNIKLNFNLKRANTGKTGALSGYITVVQIQSNTFQFFPNYKLSEKSILLQYNKGESFSISRFRPVKASFKNIDSTPAKYKILIFTRDGNLIYSSEIGPFEIVGNK